MRILPLSQELTERLKGVFPFFVPVKIPRNTYPDMEQEGLTVAVTAMLITHKDTPADKVTTLLDRLFPAAGNRAGGLSQVRYDGRYRGPDLLRRGLRHPQNTRRVKDSLNRCRIGIAFIR